MNTIFYRNNFFIATALSLFLLMLGCSDNPANSEMESTKTNEDANTAGKLVMESFNETDTITQFFEIAKSGLTALNFENEFSITDVSKLAKKRLGKTTTAKEIGASVTLNFDDTSSGKLYIILSTSTNILTSKDTLVVKWDEYAKNDVENDENIISISGERKYLDGKKVKYKIIDLDNDDVLFGASQYNGKARIDYESTSGNVIEKIVIDVSGGTDKNFDTDEDNQIIAVSWEKVSDGGASAKATFVDADEDGILLDKSKDEPSVVDVVLQFKNPPLRPLVDSIYLTLRVVTKGNGNDTIIRLSGKEYRIGGRIVTLQITDIYGNEDVMPFDTAVAILASIPVLPNGWKDTIKLVFDVQSGLQNGSDNLLYELHVSKEHQSGIVLRINFDFITTQPAKEGEKPESGHIEMGITFTDNRNATIVADFSESGFTGTYTNPQGDKLTIIWDANGNVVSSN